MLFDCHSHTEFSSDSTMKLEDALKRAKELNLGLISTEHLDLNSKSNGFKVDIDSYLKAYKQFRSDKYLIGLELGLSESIYNESLEKLKNKDFDFIIGSIHSVNDNDIFHTLTTKFPTKQEFYEQYFMNMINCIKLFSNFDSLGHIDYISRYGSFNDNEIYLREHGDYIDEVFKNIISKDKVIELNARRLNNKKSFNCLVDIYKRYEVLGGKYVTLGSDSHRLCDIGCNFKEALTLLDMTSLKPIYFKERKPQFIK